MHLAERESLDPHSTARPERPMRPQLWRLGMNHTLSSLARRGVLVLGVSLACALPAAAQTGAGGGSGTSNTTGATTTGGATSGLDTTTRAVRNDRPDYGWIGLIGLAGLLGLRRKREDPDTTRTSGRTTTTASR
jgi:MYXO-CTERM domain-containing protein